MMLAYSYPLNSLCRYDLLGALKSRNKTVNFFLILLLLLQTNLLTGMQSKSYCLRTTEAINDLLKIGRVPQRYLDLLGDDLLGLLKKYIIRSNSAFLKNSRPPQPYELSYHKTDVHKVSLSGDGMRALINDDNKAALWIFDKIPLKPLLLVKPRCSISELSMTPCGTLALISSEDMLLVWRLSVPSPSNHLLNGHKEKVSALCIARNGMQALTGDEGSTALLWKIDKLEKGK